MVPAGIPWVQTAPALTPICKTIAQVMGHCILVLLLQPRVAVHLHQQLPPLPVPAVNTGMAQLA